MPVLTINGVEYPIRPLEQTYESAVRSRRTFSGKLRTVEIMNGTVRSFKNWPSMITDSTLTTAQAETLKTLLNGTSTVALAGDLPGGTVNIRATNVVILPGPLANEAAVQFQARQA